MAIKSIGIDIREATGQRAGKARYCEEITKALIAVAPEEIEFKLFTKHHHPHLSTSNRVQQIALEGNGLKWHWQLRQHLKENPVDLMLSPTSYLVPFFAPKNQDCAVVIHDLIALLYSKGHHWFSKWVERLTIHRAVNKSRWIITVSNETLKDLHQAIPSSKKKAYSIAPPAVSASFSPVAHKSMDLPEEFLLWVGTLHPRKNLKTLLEAFQKHVSPAAPNVHLCIAGAPGWGHQTQELPNVHFLDYVSDEQLVELYSRAKALVYPSLYEGFGMPALEAMACDCPVIASNCSSLPEVVGDAALLVDPTDPKDIAHAIRRLHEEKVRTQLIEKGRARYKDFSWEASAQSILNTCSKA